MIERKHNCSKGGEWLNIIWDEINVDSDLEEEEI